MSRRELTVEEWRLTQSEAEFQARVVSLARAHGWRVYFQPDWVYRLIKRDMARRRRGDREWPDKGFPDLVLLRPPRLLVIECKTETGRVRPEQEAWLRDLRACGVSAQVWRPRHWPTVEAILTAKQLDE